MAPTARRPQLRERVEQHGIVMLLRTLGAKVYVSGTTRRKGDYAGTMMSPGIPDVEAFLPARMSTGAPSGGGTRELLKVEVKAAGGRLRPEQAEYRDLCAAADVHHIVGGLDTVIAWLIEHHYLRGDQVAHYRVRQVPA